MNERIKELYKEAYGVSLSIDDFMLDENEGKFAELIVRECANLFVTMEGSEFAEFDRFDAAKHVKKHFGVE